ncbi:MAG: ABC transporter permease, partial [Planctomycetes bacterium]|nr:ABC transporter permease [Planctomycetota bacterium]
MRVYLARRLLNILVVLVGMTLLVFLLLRLAPGSPVTRLLGEQTSAEDIAELEHALGFDQPLPVQYIRFLANIVRGDLGKSVVYSSPVSGLVLGRLPATIELTLCATLLTLVLA